jgi:NAD(P)-dependent dehydrogenase (short-subunit alcohol dehydrogenase family)
LTVFYTWLTLLRNYMTKIAIITGSAGNLGQAVVKEFITEGYQVIGTVSSIDQIKSADGTEGFETAIVDLVKEGDAGVFVNRVIEKYKRIDTAVLTVGGFAMGKIADTSTGDIYNQYKLNFETAYNVARPVFVQMMKQNAGRIFLVGSKPGMEAQSGKGMIAYGLTKSMIFRLAELMNEEAKGSGVVTSVVVPGTIDTASNRKAMPDANFDNWVKPEAIASVISYYCSQEAATLREPVIKIYGNS